MSTVIVRASGRTYQIPEARAVLIETAQSEHVPDVDGIPRLKVVHRQADWRITSPHRVDGWLGGCRTQSWAGGSVLEYGINADLVDEVTVEP